MMFRMTALVAITALLLNSSGLSAQQKVIDVGKEDVSPLSGLFTAVGGEPVSFARYVKVVEGSPFFSDDWMPGTLVMPSGKKFDSIQVKIDLLADEVHYQDKAGNPLIATSQLREIWLKDASGSRKTHFVHSSYIGSGTGASQGWHQMLTDGRAILLKKQIKEILETKPYGSSVTEQRIQTTARYFILLNNKLLSVKSLSAIPELIPEETESLRQYISSNKLKGKTDGDYISLISYFNSLPVR